MKKGEEFIAGSKKDVDAILSFTIGNLQQNYVLSQFMTTTENTHI